MGTLVDEFRMDIMLRDFVYKYYLSLAYFSYYTCTFVVGLFEVTYTGVCIFCVY